MSPDFHYRDKIAVALIGQETVMGRQLKQELTAHPWFVLAGEDEPIGLTIVLQGHSEAIPRIVEGSGQVIIPEIYPSFEPISDEPLVFGVASEPSAALAMVLQPLHAAFGLKAIRSVVMSGPGYGPNNVGPNPDLGGRIEREVREVLGLSGSTPFSIEAIGVPVSQQTVQCVSVALQKSLSCADLKQVWEERGNSLKTLNLPSAPAKSMHFSDLPGSSITQDPFLEGVQISRLQVCPIFGFKFVVTSNVNRTRILLMAELLVKTGKIFW